MQLCIQKQCVLDVCYKLDGWIMSYWERNENLPDSNVVVDWLCIDNREIDVDAIPRRYSDSPHAVLEVWILGWVSRRVNCAIHGCYIPTTESWRERRKSERLDKNRKPVFDLPQVIKLSFMAVSPLTVDKTNHNCVLLGYHLDIWGGLGAPVRHNCRGWLLVTVNLMTLSSWDTTTLPSYPFRGNVLKFDFELRVKAKALPPGSKKDCKLDTDNTVSTEKNNTIYHFLRQIPNSVMTWNICYCFT